MNRIQKASLLASALSTLWIGLFCGQAAARLLHRETPLELPVSTEFKAVVIPRLDRDPFTALNPRVQVLPTAPLASPPSELEEPIFPGPQSKPLANAGAQAIQRAKDVPAPASPGWRPAPPQPSLSPSQSPFEAPQGQDRRLVVVNASNARLRQDPSTAAAKLGTIQKGEVGQIIERSNGWTRLVLAQRGLSGWIRDDLLIIP